MVGKVFAQSNRSQLIFNINQALKSYNVRVNIYQKLVNRQPTLVVQVFDKPELLLLKELREDLDSIENIIRNETPVGARLEIHYIKKKTI